MCYKLSQRFTEIIIFFCLFQYEPSYSNIKANASLNGSEEIKNIFSPPYVTDSVLKGNQKQFRKIGNFAEGGLINENSTVSVLKSSLKFPSKNFSMSKNNNYLGSMENKNLSSLYLNMTEHSHDNSVEGSSVKSLLPAKLKETESDLFLGMPEVIHNYGTSSIKPRKGVHCSKVVPRKGVDTENETSHDFITNELCFWLSENECYNAKEVSNLKCNFCEEGNILGKKIKQQAQINCKNCNPVNKLFSDKEAYRNICCHSVSNNAYSVSSNPSTYSNKYNYPTVPSVEKVQQNISQATAIPHINVTAKNFPEKTATEVKELFQSLKKNSKPKPSITKVPHDVEGETELLIQSQQKVFIPVVVSLFLLPLIGIVIYFLWIRTKEYWNKRYYKRMDFLIDGIYND